MAFFQSSSKYFGQGHPRSHHFKSLPTGYLWAKSHNFTVNSVWDIVNVKVCHTQTHRQTGRQTDGQTPEGHYIDSLCLHTWAKNCDFVEDQGNWMLHNFEDLPTGYLLAKSHNFTVHSVRDIVNVKVCHTHTDGQTPEGHYIDSLCLHTAAKNNCF